MICILAIGNVLMGDDGLGPHVLKDLEARWILPPDVFFFDAGTPGLDLTLFLDGCDAVIAIDALKSTRGAPGEVRTFRREALLVGALPIVMSPHEPTLREALARLDLLGRAPRDVFVVGCITERVETGAPLSDTVRKALPEIEAHVLRELVRLGAKLAPRVPAATPDIWWEPLARLEQEQAACASESLAG